MDDLKKPREEGTERKKGPLMREEEEETRQEEQGTDLELGEQTPHLLGLKKRRQSIKG